MKRTTARLKDALRATFFDKGEYVMLTASLLGRNPVVVGWQHVPTGRNLSTAGAGHPVRLISGYHLLDELVEAVWQDRQHSG